MAALFISRVSNEMLFTCVLQIPFAAKIAIDLQENCHNFAEKLLLYFGNMQSAEKVHSVAE